VEFEGSTIDFSCLTLEASSKLALFPEAGHRGDVARLAPRWGGVPQMFQLAQVWLCFAEANCWYNVP
jgi:hypothetical protein